MLNEYPPSQYAGFGERAGAYIVDSIIVYILAFASSFTLAFSIALVYAMGGAQVPQDSLTILGGILGIGVGIVYYGMFVSSSWQATPGKRLFGIHIISTNGVRPSFSLGVGRYFAYIISFLPLGIGFLFPLWTDQKQALHDFVAKTRVVKGKLPTP